MLKKSNLGLRDVRSSVSTSTKKLNRCRPFHFRYLELCRAKNLKPLTEIRCKNNATSVLDFFGDKLNVNDWLLIVEALHYDQVLQTLGIRMRKTFGTVLEHVDTEKKAKLFRQKSVLYTKFIFSGVVEAISNCIEFNKNLKILNLEGLPLNDKYVESIAKALSINESIKEISLQRSNIGDKGCQAICCTIKYLTNVEKLNLSECELTTKGAEYVADMIKIQKINRYTESWQKSLRYRDVDPETIPGLRSIALSRNPKIGDDGINPIVELLKEDVWIKVIDMENCGLTDRAANLILDCLKINNYIIDFNVSGNAAISKFLLRNIREQLGIKDEDQKLRESQEELVPGPNGELVRRKKITIASLKDQIKTLKEQLVFEKVLRKKAEQLNEKLSEQIMVYENLLKNNINLNIPEGYVMVKNEALQPIIRERNDFQKPTAGIVSNDSTPRNNVALAKQRNHNKTASVANPSVRINSPQAEQRKNLKKVRKVKSEVKNIEPIANEPTRNKSKESKSDHEYYNETNYQLNAINFETNIGDSVANNISKQSNSSKSKAISKNGQNNFENLTRLELDELSIPTTRSLSSDLYSSDSDTLRYEGECQSLNVFKRSTKHKPLTPKPKTYNQEREDGKNKFKNLTKLELDELSIPTTRSSSSNLYSSDSDTLRNEEECQPLNVFKRSTKHKPLTPMPLTPKPKTYNQEREDGKNKFKNLTKLELDELSIPTTRSSSSNLYSSDSDTLRNEGECQPLNVFKRRSKPMPLTPMPKTTTKKGKVAKMAKTYNQEREGDNLVLKSPRSLFFGVCNDKF